MARSLPTHAELVDYNYAVAGHDGLLCDADGELFIKPCTTTEINFYETSVADHPEFAKYMPTFLGTLSLDADTNGKTIEEAGAALLAKQVHGTHHADALPTSNHIIHEVGTPKKTSKKIVTNQAIVLQNASHGFVKPNILDVKLGVRLYADDAAPEKKARFDKVTEDTTHKEFGFRIAGMRVWQGHGAVGKDIDVCGYKFYDKNYGRLSLNADNIHEAFRDFIFVKTAGIDEELGGLITQAFLTDVRHIQEALESQESRMFSASLLFVYEGDGVALRTAMEEASQSPEVRTNGVESGDEIDDDNEDEDDEIKSPKIYSVNVIDFAHATWNPGMGPDENSLKGVRSVAKILEQLAGPN